MPAARPEDEIAPRVERQADRVRGMRPDEEADDADRGDDMSNPELAEDRRLQDGRDDMVEDAKTEQDQEYTSG